MKVIFEDLDGPIIPYDTDSDVDYHTFFDDIDKWNRKAIKNLNKIVKKTDAKVVISSSYRTLKTLDEIQTQMNKAGFRYEVYDVVQNDVDKERGADIDDWLDNHEVEKFIIIDDHNHDFKDIFNNKIFIKTGHKKGITKKIVKKAIKQLNK